MDEAKHGEFTGAKAVMENKVGGKFSVWDGYAKGTNLELVPGKKIVQSWRASDWQEKDESTVTLKFTPSKDGTELEFMHENIPEEFEKEIEMGWTDYYWKPLREYLKKNY